MVRVFEAPPQTRDAILSKYGEVFVEIDDEGAVDMAAVWKEIEEASRIPDLNQRNQALDAALSDISWYLDRNIRTIVDINQQMIEEQISEGIAEWLCYQTVPLDRLDERLDDDDDQTLIWPEDKDRAVETFEWYMTARKDSKVQNMMREMFPGRSIKNPLEFSIYDLEDLQDTLTPVKQQTAKNQRWKPEERGIAPGKARTILDDDGWLIVEITDAAVASSYASGTRWCTSNRRTAQGYLNDGPLYVLFRNGQKYGQIHGQSNQIMDVRDRSIQNLDPFVARFMAKESEESLIKTMVACYEEPTSPGGIWSLAIEQRRREILDSISDDQERIKDIEKRTGGISVSEDNPLAGPLIRSLAPSLSSLEVTRYQESIRELRTYLADLDKTGDFPRKDEYVQRIRGQLSQRLQNEVRSVSNLYMRVPEDQRAGMLSPQLLESMMLMLEFSGFDDASAIMPLMVMADDQALVDMFIEEYIRTPKFWLADRQSSDHRERVNLVQTFIRSFGIGNPLLEPWFDSWSQNPQGSEAMMAMLQEMNVFESYSIQGLLNWIPVMRRFGITADAIKSYFTDDTRGNRSNLKQFIAGGGYADEGAQEYADEIREALVSLGPEWMIEELGIAQGQLEYIPAQDLEFFLKTHGPDSLDAYRNVVDDSVEGDLDVDNLGAALIDLRSPDDPLINPLNQMEARRTHNQSIALCDDPDMERGRLVSKPNNSSRYYSSPQYQEAVLVTAKPDDHPELTAFVYDLMSETDVSNLNLRVDLTKAPGMKSYELKRMLSSFIDYYVWPLTSESERTIRQQNLDGDRARPPAVLGWGCPSCGVRIEYDQELGHWASNDYPQERRDEQFDFYFRGVENDGSWSNWERRDCISSWRQARLEAGEDQMDEDDWFPHLVNNITNSDWSAFSSDWFGPGVLWCTSCDGVRAISDDMRASAFWKNNRKLIPCRCGFTKRSLDLYEAEAEEPTEAQITEEITGALGSGGPTGLNQTAYEAEYTRIAAGDMESFLTDLGFERVNVPRAREAVYDRTYGRGPDDGRLVTRVYSSIVGSSARDAGRDAIRVVPIYVHPTLGDFPMARMKRVHRVTGWRDNLRARIDDSEARAPGPVLDSNGKPMVLRKNRRTGDHFWGSVDYPGNRETRPYRGG